MSILDFTVGLFRDPAVLRSFIDDPDRALADAGLPDATPAQVHDLLPVVAESMAPDHPLQSVVHSADPVGALGELDVDEMLADIHHHHHHTQLIEKALGPVECRPGDDDGPAGSIHVRHWDVVEQGEKALGELPALRVEESGQEPLDDYSYAGEDHHRIDDHAVDDDGVGFDISGVAWGQAVE